MSLSKLRSAIYYYNQGGLTKVINQSRYKIYKKIVYPDGGHSPQSTPSPTNKSLEHVKLSKKDIYNMLNKSMIEWPQLNPTPYSEDELENVPDLIEHRGGLHATQTARSILKCISVPPNQLSVNRINKASSILDAQLETMDKHDRALYAPFDFKFATHNDQEPFDPPWYSGMAQGICLSAVTRLDYVDETREYRPIANKIFRSFTQTGIKDDKPWIALIDENNYYWIEEYPHDNPVYVLNGMIFGLLGVYEYAQMYQNKIAEDVLRAGIKTLKDNIDRYRCKNSPSYYCLKYGNNSIKYHYVHIEQLNILDNIIQDDCFKNICLNFKKDIDYNFIINLLCPYP